MDFNVLCSRHFSASVPAHSVTISQMFVSMEAIVLCSSRGRAV